MSQPDETASNNATFELDGVAPRIAGICFTSHGDQVEWELRPTNPVLKAGDPLPDVVYGDVGGPRINGRPHPNNRTYARWDVTQNTLTLAAYSLDPAPRTNS